VARDFCASIGAEAWCLVIPQLRNAVLRKMARVLVRSTTFRHHLGVMDADFDPQFIRAASLLREASDEDAVFVRDLVRGAVPDIAVWVLHETRHKIGGYFVEFGAADGIVGSNTYSLEKDYAWRGILAEPNPDWHDGLLRNRRAAIDLRCVFKNTGSRVPFAATNVAALATIAEYASCDGHARSRAAHRIVEVETVSLNDLLATHDAPREIDFISIDTEGSEYEIISGFDFGRWDVRLFAIEHNRTDRQAKIDELMCRNGYERRYAAYPVIDSWYRRIDRR
jgi:FkbM family methyltransferase